MAKAILTLPPVDWPALLRRGLPSFRRALLAAGKVVPGPARGQSLQAWRSASMSAQSSQAQAARKRLGVALSPVADMGMEGHARTMLPAPVPSFEASGLPAHLIASARGLGFREPTPIQAQAWPLVLAGHNVVGVAPTGSGKTAAFMLPALAHIAAHPDHGHAVPATGGGVGAGPSVLVLAPTRELASQIHRQATRLGSGQPQMRSVLIIGGAPKAEQDAACMPGSKRDDHVRLVVATPGRLLDMLFRKVPGLNLAATTMLILDEADRMLDLGFAADMLQIAGQVRPASSSIVRKGKGATAAELPPQESIARQTLLFTATWPESVRNLARQVCGAGTGSGAFTSVLLNVLGGGDDRSASASSSSGGQGLVQANSAVLQKWIFPGDDGHKTKLPLLMKTLKHGEHGILRSSKQQPNKKKKKKKKQKQKKGTAGDDARARQALVFVSRRDRAAQLAGLLRGALRKLSNGADKGQQQQRQQGTVTVAALHGKLDQDERAKILAQFRTGELRVLVATDVAARGLDVPSLELVVNYDFPRQCQHPVETYAHRIGRTGRAGQVGTAVSFFVSQDSAGGVSPHLVKMLRAAGQTVPKQLAKYAAQPIPLDQRK